MSHWADLYLPIPKVKKTNFKIKNRLGNNEVAFILKLVNLGLDKGRGRGG